MALQLASLECARLGRLAHGGGAFADPLAALPLRPRLYLRVDRPLRRYADDYTHLLAMGGGRQKVERQRASLQPALAERAHQDRRELLHMDGAGHQPATKT